MGSRLLHLHVSRFNVLGANVDKCEVQKINLVYTWKWVRSPGKQDLWGSREVLT